MGSVSFNSVPAGAAASARYIEQANERRTKNAAVLPQRITFPAQYNSGKTPTANVPVQITSLGDIQTRAGRGSMAALVYEALRRTCGGVDIYWIPLADDAGGVVATKTLTYTGNLTGSGTHSLLIAGRKVQAAMTSGMTPTQQAAAMVAAITADLDSPFTAANAAGVVTLTARNKGALAHSYQIIQDPDLSDLSAEPAGISCAIANGTAGTTDPSLDTSLANLGGAWHTVLVNPYPSASTTQITSIETAWAARIDPGVKRPFACIMGYTDTLANFTTWLSSRNSPAITAIPVEGSPSPCWEIAATAAGIFARANDAAVGPSCNGLVLTGVRGNASYPLWTGTQRDTIVKAGGSWTTLNADGTVSLGDMVTTYKTNAQGVADAATSWRFTDTIANEQAKLYSLDYLINSAPYVRAVVVDDASPCSKAYAVRPKTLKADLVALVDDWVLMGWSKDRDAIVAGIVVEIDANNAGRMNFYVPDVMSAGLRILAGKYGWSFQSAT